MNGTECTDCGVGTFHDKLFHRDTACINCSGTLFLNFDLFVLK